MTGGRANTEQRKFRQGIALIFFRNINKSIRRKSNLCRIFSLVSLKSKIRAFVGGHSGRGIVYRTWGGKTPPHPRVAICEGHLTDNKKSARPESERTEQKTATHQFDTGGGCCKLKRRGRRNHSGRQSRPHFGIFASFGYGVVKCARVTFRCCNQHKCRKFRKKSGVASVTRQNFP